MAAIMRFSSGFCRVCAGIVRAPHRALPSEAPSPEYRSAYSLDKLYTERGREEQQQQQIASSSPNIPVNKLAISYSRSSGPGGQNVNKVNTKAEIRFQLAAADWISEDVRVKMAEKHKNQINKSGELIITSELSRYQMRNLADCLQKLRDMITQSSFQPQPTKKEHVELRRSRVQAMNRERLQQKRIHSIVKQSRRGDVD